MNATSIAPLWVRCLALAPLTCLIALSPSRAIAATFGEVMDWCSAPRIEGDEKLCSGYLKAALELLRAPDPVLNGGHRICAPAGDQTKAIVPILASWSKQHPDARGKEAVTTIGDALVDRYPCP
jgi:hypothetical protein